MCLVMLTDTYCWCDVVSISRQGSLVDGWGLEAAYLQHDYFGSATAGKMTHQNWNLLNDCDWNCLAHTLDLHEVGVFSGFCNCFCDVSESSFDSINLKSDCICCILCIVTSWQGIEIPVHGWNYHIYYSNQASYVFFYCHKVSWPGLSLDFQESCAVLFTSWSSLLIVFDCGKLCSLVSHQI